MIFYINFLQDFKNTQNFEELRSSLLSICVSQGLRKNAPIDDKIIGRQLITQSSKPRSISRPEQQEKPSINNLPKLDDTKKKTNYASMALERKVQRTNSQKEIKFEMILRKGSTNEEIEINNRQNNKTDPFKISVGQREMNSGFEKLINDFYQQENQNHFVT